MLVTVNNRLILEIEIVHDLSCHPILCSFELFPFIGAYCAVCNVNAVCDANSNAAGPYLLT